MHRGDQTNRGRYSLHGKEISDMDLNHNADVQGTEVLVLAASFPDAGVAETTFGSDLVCAAGFCNLATELDGKPWGFCSVITSSL